MTKFPPLDLQEFASNIFLAPAPAMKVCKCGEVKIPAFWDCCGSCSEDRGPFEFERDQEPTGEDE